MRLVALAGLVAFMVAIGLLETPWRDEPLAAGRLSMALGFLLLTGYVLGQLARRLGLPRITGFLVAGIVFGPHVGGQVSTAVIDRLGLVDDIALCLIALAAGGEIELRRLRPLLRGVGLIVAGQTVVVLGGAALLVAVLPMERWLGLDDAAAVWAIGALVAVIALANSPSTTIAVILDLDADGPLSETALAVTVLKDVLVIVLFALALSLAVPALDPSASFAGRLLGHVALEVAGSVLLGIVVGHAMALFLCHVSREEVLFVLLMVFGVATACAAWQLNALIACVVAGIWVENRSDCGEGLMRAIDRSSMPVFVLFFALAGARLDVDTLPRLWLPALALVAGRALFTAGGTALGARLAGAEPPMVRWGWMAFLAQAGVSLGFVALIQRELPARGQGWIDVIVAAVVINQLVGPVAFKIALDRLGESGKLETGGPAAPVAHEDG